MPLAIASLVLGLVGDVSVIVSTLEEGTSYMEQMGSLAAFWWILFLGWQGVALYALIRSRFRRGADLALAFDP